MMGNQPHPALSLPILPVLLVFHGVVEEEIDKDGVGFGGGMLAVDFAAE